jgi:hypothetical protein
MEDISNMVHINNYTPTSHVDHSHAFKVTPIKACITFLSKLSYCCHRKTYVSLSNQEEETMVGYESSWAGISNNTKFK